MRSPTIAATGVTMCGLFEIGTRFAPQGETRAVGVAWTGAAAPLHWSGSGRAVDFFDVKGVVELLARALGVSLGFAPADEPFLVAGEGAAIVCAGGPADGSVVGLAGQIAPPVADARGLTRQDRVFVAELNLDQLERARASSSDATQPLPRFPFVVRDLSIVVASTLPAEIIRGTIQAAARDVPAPLTVDRVLRSLSGQGRAGRIGQHFRAPDVPGARSHVNRRRSSGQRRQNHGGADPRTSRRAEITTSGHLVIWLSGHLIVISNRRSPNYPINDQITR